MKKKHKKDALLKKALCLEIPKSWMMGEISALSRDSGKTITNFVV
jgi:hypothetical protein